MKKLLITSAAILLFAITYAQPGAALNFDGVNDYITVPNNASLNISSAITLEGWVYATKNTGVQNVMIKSDCSTSNTSYGFPRTDDGWQNFVAYFYIGGTWQRVYAPYPGLNQWHHLAATYDGTYIRTYLDGNLAATSPPYPGGIFVNSNPLTLGTQIGCGNEYFGGSADNLRIWDRALCQDEIQYYMNCEIPGSANGLVANYNLNQGIAGSNNSTVTTLTDLSGYSNNGTLINFALSGGTSNWIAPGGVTSGNSCNSFPLVTALNQSNVSCNGGSNGSASVSATGGSGFTYDWTPGNPTGDGTSSVSGLTAGSWTCTVTNNCGATGAYTFSITEPTAITLSSSVTQVSCNGGCDGSATVIATGGTPSYLYDWLPTTPNCAGTYFCTVTDMNGCTATTSVTVTQPTQITISTSSTSASCYAYCDGSATATANGGIPPYNYMWIPAGPNNLCTGTYTVLVTDANGCTEYSTAAVTQPPSIGVAYNEPTDTACQTTSGLITLSGGSPTGGTFSGPNVSGGVFDPTNATLGNNIITYTYTDSAGCTDYDTDTIYVDLCLDVSQVNGENEVDVFPNPTTGKIAINAEAGSVIRVFDVSGKELMNQTVGAAKTQIDLSGYDDGIYLVVVRKNDNHSAQRIVLKK